MTDEARPEGTPASSPPNPRLMLAVLIRQQGRVRVTQRELDDAAQGKIGLKALETGGWVLEWQEKA